MWSHYSENLAGWRHLTLRTEHWWWKYDGYSKDHNPDNDNEYDEYDDDEDDDEYDDNDDDDDDNNDWRGCAAAHYTGYIGTHGGPSQWRWRWQR